MNPFPTVVRQSLVGTDFTAGSRNVVCRASGVIRLTVSNFNLAGGFVCVDGSYNAALDISPSNTGGYQPGAQQVQITGINANGTYTARYSFEWAFAQAPAVSQNYFLRVGQQSILPAVGVAACLTDNGTVYSLTHQSIGFTCQSIPDVLR